MPRNRTWDNEVSAAALVSVVLGGHPERTDTAGAQQTHDFDIVLTDGQVVALEVTREVDPAVRSQHALEDKLDWSSFDDLNGFWHVSVIEPCDVKALHSELPGVLAEMQLEGLTVVSLDRRAEQHGTLAKLRRLGAVAAVRLQDRSPGEIALNSAPIASSTAIDVPVDVANAHLSRPDNVRKLRAARADERHLFVWITVDRTAAVASFALGSLPTAPPLLPDGVDAVWLATAYEPPTVWRFHRVGGWADVSPRRSS